MKKLVKGCNTWSIIVFFALCPLSSCLPQHYFLYEPGPVTPELTDGEYIPQAGIVIEIPMEEVYHKVSFIPPKLTLAHISNKFKYRVTIDDDLYSCGTELIWYEGIGFTIIPIPIMANNSYTFKRIKIEGAVTQGFKSDEWSDWEVLYEGTQDCLGEGQTPRYSGLKDKRLKVIIDGEDVLYYTFVPGFSSEAFKRLLFDAGQIEYRHCALSYYDISVSKQDGFFAIPQNESAVSPEIGQLYVGFNCLVFTLDGRLPSSGFTSSGGFTSSSGFTFLANLEDGGEGILDKLVEMSAAQSPKIVWISMMLSLCD